MRARGNGGTIQVELTDTGLKAIEAYREKMLGMIGVELTESQIANMLIHFGNEALGRGHSGSLAALPAPATTSEAPPPRASRFAKPRGKARTCACGCGENPLTDRATWMPGHWKRGKKAARAGAEKERVVWDGRGPLTPAYDRNDDGAF